MAATDLPEEHGSRRRAWPCVIGVLSVHALALATLLVTLSRVFPQFEKFFADHDIELPAIAKLVVSWSHLAMTFGRLFFPLALAIDLAALWALKFKLAPAPWLFGVWAHGWTLWAVFCLAFIIHCVAIVFAHTP